MSEVSEMSRIASAIARRWPVVLVATVVGALLMVGWGLTRAPETGYTSSARVRIGSSNLPNMPTVDLLMEYGNSPAAKQAVEESASLDPKGVSLAASADPKSKTGVIVSAKAPEAEKAVEWANAAAEQTRQYGLSQLGALIQLEEARSARLEKRVEELEAEIARTRARAESADSESVAAQYLTAAQDLEAMLATALNDLDVSRYARAGYLSYVTVQPASAPKKSSGQTVLVSDVLRGALVGLFIGALIAALLEGRRASR